jgi:hypothetical protein
MKYRPQRGGLKESTRAPPEAEAWAARFKLRIIERLMIEQSPWTRQQAIDAANAEYNGLDEPIDLTDDPVAAADESMSYWDDDGE